MGTVGRGEKLKAGAWEEIRHRRDWGKKKKEGNEV